MGIEDFKVAPDNPGGRPTKEEREEEDGLRDMYGDPYTPNKGDEWWEEKIDEVLASSEIPTDDFGDFVDATRILSDWTHISTIEVWKQLKEYELAEFDWEWVREEAPDEWKDLRWPKKARYEVFEVDTDTSTEEEEYTGGLASLVDEAKESE